MGKKVPLVIYVDGQREVIGLAEIDADGMAHCTVDDKHAKEIIGDIGLNQFSISVSLNEEVSLVDLKPCHGKNANVCVAEGCFGEECLSHKREGSNGSE